MLFLFAFIFSQQAFAFSDPASQSLPLVMDFEDWKKIFQPEGFHSQQEDLVRRQIFEKNVAFILKQNAKVTSVVFQLKKKKLRRSKINRKFVHGFYLNEKQKLWKKYLRTELTRQKRCSKSRWSMFRKDWKHNSNFQKVFFPL